MTISKLKALACGLALLSVPALADPVSRPRPAAGVSSGVVLKAGTAIVSGLNVVSAATAGYALLLDSATIPADGAVLPVFCLPVATNTGISTRFTTPLYLQNGATLLFSSTGCFTKTAVAASFLSGDIQ
jgi:hypothetical protein